MRKQMLSAVAVCAVLTGYNGAGADEAAAQRWVDDEFQQSTLSKEEQLGEMKWFIEAPQPHAGMEIKLLSEGSPTQGYESDVLT